MKWGGWKFTSVLLISHYYTKSKHNYVTIMINQSPKFVIYYFTQKVTKLNIQTFVLNFQTVF